MQSSPTSWVVLARLIRPQGRKGEVLADLLSDFPETFPGRTDLFLVPAAFTGDRMLARSVEVTSSWLPVGKNAGRIVLQLAGIHTITEAETVSGFDLVVPDHHRMPLEEDSMYVADLIGCSLFNEDAEVGPIVDVQFPVAADGSRLPDAPALLTVQSEENGEVLIPFVKAFVKTIDLPAKRLVMKLPAGLIEVNRKS